MTIKMPSPTNPWTVAVFFGGRSVEHEISIISALQAIQAIDTTCYKVHPIYISPQGHWYTGELLLNKKIYCNWSLWVDKLQQITLLPDPSIQGFIYMKDGHATEKNLHVDVCFLVFHGQGGEDGCIQGLLELAEIPYTGCGVGASAVCMDKYICKKILQAHEIPVLPCIRVKRADARKNLQKVHEQILSMPGFQKFPLFIKPCNLGSSIGVSKATDLSSLSAALARAFRYDEEALIEPCLTHLLEINVAVLDGDPPVVSVVEVPVPGSAVLTYEDKYLRGGGKKTGPCEGMASLTRMIDPQDLDPTIKRQVQDYAKTIFKLLKASGVSRLDFMLDIDSGKLYFNEINTIPGSLAFYLWEKTTPRLVYTEVIDRMLKRAVLLRQERLALEKEIEFLALKTSAADT